MKYQDYINLGFERTDLGCNVEYRNTGYHGFTLEKQVNERISVSVCSGELDTPKMYIKKSSGETYHIIPVSDEVVKDMLFAAS